MGTPWALPGDASRPLLGRFWDVPGPLGKALEKSSLIAAGYNGSPVMEARKKRKVPNLSKKHEQKTEEKNAKKIKKKRPTCKNAAYNGPLDNARKTQ